MHVKFMSHGKGSGSAAIKYLMGEENHLNEQRDFAPEVLCGNPEQTANLINSIDRKLKYRSAVISFHPDDQPTDKQLDEVLSEFKRVAFAGMDHDQYDMTAVLHREKESCHIHIIIPREELSTGKAFNPAPPGWRKSFDPMRDLMNAKNDWVSPDISLNPQQARLTQPSLDALRGGKRLETIRLIESYLVQRIETGAVTDRASVIESLKDAGLEINRAGSNYITVKDPETDQKVRLKGALYAEDWTVERALESDNSRGIGSNRELNERRVKEFSEQLEQRIEKLSEYNDQEYPKSSATTDRGAEISADREREIAEAYSERQQKIMEKARVYRLDDYSRNSSGKLGTNELSKQLDSEQPKRDRAAGIELERTSEKDGRRTSEKVRRATGALHSDKDTGTELSERLQNCSNTLGAVKDENRDQQNVVSIVSRIDERLRSADAAATRANREIITACGAINAEIQRSDQAFKSGIRAVRDNNSSELDRFKTQINLVEYAASQGYKLDRKNSSPSSKAMKNDAGEKIIIMTDKDGHGIYFNTAGTGDSGTIIDFIQNRDSKNLGQIRKELRRFGGFTDIEDAKSYGKPSASEKDFQRVNFVYEKSRSGVNQYLSGREISNEIMTDSRFSSVIKTDARDNAVFPHYNKAGLCGYELKGEGFTGFAKGGEKGLWMSSNVNTASKIVVCESTIDALSHAELNANRADLAYISFGGTMSEKQKDYLLDLTRDKQVIIGVDNDKAGEKYADFIREHNPTAKQEKPASKDWNDDLKAAVNEEVEAALREISNEERLKAAKESMNQQRSRGMSL